MSRRASASDVSNDIPAIEFCSQNQFTHLPLKKNFVVVKVRFGQLSSVGS